MAGVTGNGHCGAMTKKTSYPGHGLDGFYEALRRPGITRVSDGRWFAGVAAGLARRLGVDPLVVRAGFILLGLLFGMGVALYLVLWLLMPDEKGKLPIEAALKYGDGGSIFLLVIAGISVFGGGPWWKGDFSGFRAAGLVALIVGVWWFLTQTDAGRDLLKSRPPGAPTDPAAPPPTTGVSTGNAAAAAGATLTTPTTPSPAPQPAPTWTPSPAAYGQSGVRTRGIGFAAGLLVLGLATLVGALTLSIADSAGWNGSHLTAAVAAALATLGLGLVVGGLAGRSSGWLTPFAIFGIVVALMSMAVPRGMRVPFQVGDHTSVVTSLSGDNRHELGAGNLRVDLSHADFRATPTMPDVVHATVGLGQLDLVVPQGVDVVVHAQARAGELRAVGSNQPTSTQPGRANVVTDGTNWDKTVTFGSETGKPEIEVYAEIGLGQINITTATPAPTAPTAPTPTHTLPRTP